MLTRIDDMSNMGEKEQLKRIISEYDKVASHYKEFSIASRGARNIGACHRVQFVNKSSVELPRTASATSTVPDTIKYL